MKHKTQETKKPSNKTPLETLKLDVSKDVNKLETKGLVETLPNGNIRLTSKGHEMAKELKAKKEKPSIWTKVLRFFFPKDWKAEMYKGRAAGGMLKQDASFSKIIPTWWLGKLFRKIVDPRHEMKVGSQKGKKRK